MELYFHPASGCSRRVLALLGHLDLPFTPHLVELGAGAQREPAYRALNPNGKVPTLVDGELVLWESVAILRHLARMHRPALLGEGREEIEVDRWLAWTLNDLAPAISRLNAETGLKRMRGIEPDPVAVQAARQAVAPRLALLDAHLGRSEYLAGPNVTLAEFAAAPSIEGAMGLARLSLDELPHVGAWLERVRGLDGWPAPLGAGPRPEPPTPAPPLQSSTGIA